jgi:hypothetical protein
MDLPYTYSVDGSQEVTFHDNTKEMMASGMKIGLALMTKNPILAAMEAKNLFDMATQKKADPAAQERTRMEKTSLAHVVQFSGCKDNQTSADATIGGQATGAMSWALITSLNRKRETTLTELLKDLRQLLYGKYQQIPQMSTSHLWNVNQDRFTLI